MDIVRIRNSYNFDWFPALVCWTKKGGKGKPWESSYVRPLYSVSYVVLETVLSNSRGKERKTVHEVKEGIGGSGGVIIRWACWWWRTVELDSWHCYTSLLRTVWPYFWTYFSVSLDSFDTLSSRLTVIIDLAITIRSRLSGLNDMWWMEHWPRFVIIIKHNYVVRIPPHPFWKLSPFSNQSTMIKKYVDD